MSEEASQTSGAGSVQVFQLTMDNPEDQDELQRRLRKPGEAGRPVSPNNGPVAPGNPTAESGGKINSMRKGTT
jgi:hypothetical protein